MKILAIADEESKSLWDYFEKSKLEGIDLILSCGDLNPNYLSFLATFSSAPVLYIHGNHDDRYAKAPPKAVSISKIRFTSTTACGSWGWADLSATNPASISIPSGR